MNRQNFDKIKAANAIYLEDANGTEGRPFKSRFLQAGLVKYDFGVCLLKKETIDKFVNTFVGQPIIINHKDDITEADRVGTINNIWFSPEDGWFWCDGIITDEKAIELIENGYNVSCQYRITDYADNTEGKLHNANPYDKEILNGVFEHLAIVENPRYEDAFIAVNAYIATNNIVDVNGMKHSETNGQFVGDSDNNSSSIKEWGTAYKEYSGKPQEAIEHLLNTKNGYVPAAITKEGIGDIDFVYGKAGEGGFGLAHIIERRNEDGIDGEAFVKRIPEIIQKGEVKIKPDHKGRKYITTSDNEVSIRLDYNGENRNWIVSAYVLHTNAKNSLTQADVGFRTYDINHSDKQYFPLSDLVRTNNSITDNLINFNPNITISKGTHKYNKVFDYIRNMKGESMDNETKGIFNQLIDALKARNEAEEEPKKDEKEETASNEDVDKRDIIRQIMAIAGKHEDNEDVRTIAKLAEKLAYDKSETGTADNGKAKNEDDEDDEKEVKNKCKNEDDTDYKKLYEDLKENVEKEAENKKAKNSLDALKKVFFEGEDYKPESGYMTQKQGIELGKKLY